MKKKKNLALDDIAISIPEMPTASLPQPPKVPLFANAKDFKKGRHWPSEIEGRKWIVKTAKSISNATNAELETYLGLHGSPDHSKGAIKKNGCHVSKVMRKEAGASPERNKDLVARNLIAQGWLPQITTYGCPASVEISYGTARNFDRRWPNRPDKPIPQPLMALARKEVEIREQYYESVDKKIKRHQVVLKKLRVAICEVLYNTNALRGFIVDSTADLDLDDYDDIPTLMLLLFELDERLSVCDLIVPPKPPAISIDLVRGIQGAREFVSATFFL
jgi:hypothetical protein